MRRVEDKNMKQEARARKKRTSSGLKGANTCESITAASTIINLEKGVFQFKINITSQSQSVQSNFSASLRPSHEI